MDGKGGNAVIWKLNYKLIKPIKLYPINAIINAKGKATSDALKRK